jgi:hypothetical protein
MVKVLVWSVGKTRRPGIDWYRNTHTGPESAVGESE